MAKRNQITQSSTAEYFAKNLQQVGFSSPIKAVLTTLKEAVDNSLDACEEAGLLPEIEITVEKIGKGSSKNADLIKIKISDNGPGIEESDLTKVYGEYLASSKFGRGQCSRGQQGIGISAATTWAQLTNAKGAKVISKTQRMRKAVGCFIDVDIKGNKGVMRKRETLDWDRSHGVCVEFHIDGRIQLNGDGGLLTYLEGTTLVNPHLSLHYKLLDRDWVHIERVSDETPAVPQPTAPHPHTMKLGEFITHAHLFGKMTLSKFLKTGFSRVSDNTLKELQKNGLKKSMLNKTVSTIAESEFKTVFQTLQETDLLAPSTRSVLKVGEEALSKSILRLGEVDFFSVLCRRPTICDFKPVVIEVALARFENKRSESGESSVQLLRFANRVPLQFDKAACAVTQAIESVNWKAYGLSQPKNSLPLGPYVFAVSVVSPFIKFKNASKETVDSSGELVDEIRRALIQAGQKLSRHIKKEFREADLERKKQHIEQFGPILVDTLVRLTGASEKRRKKAIDGLSSILGRDADQAEEKLASANERLAQLKKKQDKVLGVESSEEEEAEVVSKTKKRTSPKVKAVKKAVKKKVAKKVAKKKTAKKKATKKKPVKKTAKKKVAKKKITKKVKKKASKKKKR